MLNARRWYVYLVSAIALNVVVWAVIAVGRNLFVPALQPETLAVLFQISVIIIGLPIFLGHWVAAEWLARKSEEERGATLRRFYLYAMLAAFLGPLLANAFGLLAALMQPTTAVWAAFDRVSLTRGQGFVYHLLGLLVLGVLWGYHQWVLLADAKTVPARSDLALVRRWYVLGFSAAGLTMTALGVIHLLRWLMAQIGSPPTWGSYLDVVLAAEIARLLVGVPVWVVFWLWAQRLFGGPDQAEQESVLRKFYLYAVVFASVLGVVGNSTGILAGVFRRLLSLPPEGDIRQPLPIIIVLAVLWVYEALVIQGDAKQASKASQQAGVQRLYWYLVAAIGLLALVIGLAGVVNVIIQALSESFGDVIREQLAWFAAAIIAGGPVWLLPWWQAHRRAIEDSPAGADARRSMVRKLYLYFFLFVAAMTLLASAVYVVFGTLTTLLGISDLTLSEFARAVAFSVIAIGVWGYHGLVLRGDGQTEGREKAKQLADLQMVVLDVGDGALGQAVVAALKSEAPDLSLAPLVVPLAGADPVEGYDEQGVLAQLAGAALIVAPWQVAVSGGAVSPAVVQAVTASPARKLLTPTSSDGWVWVGVEHREVDAMAKQVAHAVRQIAAGEEVEPQRPMGAANVLAIGCGGLVGLVFLIGLVSFIAEELF